MLKKLFSLIFVFSLIAPNQPAYSLENTESLTSNRLYQHWLNWESRFDLPTIEASNTWVKPGNSASFAWTHSPNVRSFGEMFTITGDDTWLYKMKADLELIYSYRSEDSFNCYGYQEGGNLKWNILKGWKNTDIDEGFSYSVVHQGRILTAFLEYVEHVRSLDNPPPELVHRANIYEAYAIEVINLINASKLYGNKQHLGELVGYYNITGDKHIQCNETPTLLVGPHNQTLAIGTVLDLLTRLGHSGYQTKIVEMARGLKHDLTIPVGARHYEWPYWPTYSTTYEASTSNQKAEDHSHAEVDIEFVVAIHQAGYLDDGSKLFSSTDISRFVATMTDKLDRGHDYFSLRVNGIRNFAPKSQGRVNSMKRGWALLGQYHRPILDIGDRWCTNNNSLTNATLLKLGGLELSCPGWCPSVFRGDSDPKKEILATFDSQAKVNGWQKSSTTICNDYGDEHHIDYPEEDPLHGSSVEDPDARLKARGGRGYFEIFEQDNSDQTCNPQEFGSKDLAFYRDLNLYGDEPLIELAGFSRSKSSATSTTSTVTNRSAFFLDRDDDYSPLGSTQDLNFVGSQDSFWQPFNVVLDPSGKTALRAVVGMRDSWGNDHNQSLELDDVIICRNEYCGNDHCGSDESIETCPTDCNSALVTISYDFQGGVEGWIGANIDGYSYSNVNGALVAEESTSGGTHNLDLLETAGLELAWYKDFDRQNDIPVVLKGHVIVSAENANVGPINNLCVAIVDPSLSGYPVVVKQCQKWINTTSSGEHKFEYDFTKELENNRLYRVVIGTFDSWGAFKGQKLEIKSVEMTGLAELAPPAIACGNNICETGENNQNCSADCPLQPRISSFDFSNGSQGWLNTSSSLYEYTVTNGKLIGEEVSAGTEPNPPEAADLDINWYQDFDYNNQGNFSVSGEFQVFSNNSTTNAKTTRYCVALVAVETDTSTMIPGSKICKHWCMTTDSGLRFFNEDYTGLVQDQPRVRVVIGMPDSWSGNKEQKIEITSIEVTHGME